MDTTEKNTSSNLGKIIYPLRIVGFVFSGVILTSFRFDSDQLFETKYFIQMGLLITWPYLAFYLFKKGSQRRMSEYRNFLIDGFLLGMCVVLIDFNSVPTLIIILSIVYMNIMVKGFLSMLYSVLTFTIGLFMYALIFGYKIDQSEYLITNVVSLGLFFVFTATGSIILYNLTVKIRVNRTDYKARKNEIESFTNKINNHNLEIINGIYYAKNIKSSFMPSEEDFRSVFKNSFILDYSHQIVSGNFYWLKEKDNVVDVIIAKSQNTGVHGAMLNLICLNLFINIFRKGDVPREKVISTFLHKFDKLTRKHRELFSESLEIAYVQIDKSKNMFWATGVNSFIDIKHKNIDLVNNINLSPNKRITSSTPDIGLDEISYRIEKNDIIFISVGMLDPIKIVHNTFEDYKKSIFEANNQNFLTIGLEFS